MSLQSRLGELITAIGADIKALQASVTALGGTSNKYNAATASQTLAASDTYLGGSRIDIPQGKIQQGTIYRCKFNVVKTAAGTSAPVITVRIGTLGTVSDTARGTLTFAAQTTVIDEGIIEVDITFRQAGATAVFQSLAKLFHRLVTTGLNVTATNTFVLNTSGSFDITGAGLRIGLSVNAGGLSAWTVSVVQAELLNLAP